MRKGGGFDTASEQVTDLLATGIIDPTKVTHTALQNTASVCGLMLTTEVMVTEIPGKKKAPAAPTPEEELTFAGQTWGNPSSPLCLPAVCSRTSSPLPKITSVQITDLVSANQHEQ